MRLAILTVGMLLARVELGNDPTTPGFEYAGFLLSFSFIFCAIQDIKEILK